MSEQCDLRRTELCDEHFDTSYTVEGDQHCMICAMQASAAEMEKESGEQFRSDIPPRELLQERISALEKVAKAAMKLRFYHPDFFELHDALKAAGYGGGE